MSIDANDPRLTAYALGELNETERAVIESALEQNPELRAAVAVRGSTRTTTRPRSTVVHRAPQGCQLARTVRGAL